MVECNCSVDGCHRKGVRTARGMCWAHYCRLRKYGTTDDQRKSPAERFWAKVQKTETCWNWTAFIHPHGYGLFGASHKKVIRAHRYAYEMLVEPIPPGMQIDHICHNRACVNPDHLRLATAQENNQNHSGARADNKSGVRGVYRAESGRWRGCVTHGGRKYGVGRFNTIKEAEAAVIAKRNELHTHNDLDRDLAHRGP